MDAKKVGLYVIFGMAIAYLISAIGWSGSRISKCNEQFEKAIADIDFEVLKGKNNIMPGFDVSPAFATETGKQFNKELTAATTAEAKEKVKAKFLELFANKAKEVSEAKKKLCLSNSENKDYFVWQMNTWAHFYDNKHFSSSDIVSDVGVSSIGYLVMYCLLFVAVGLGIFATIKDNKIMMITFSATFGVSALILFIFNIVFMARSIAPRNNYSKAMEDLEYKERLGFKFLQYGAGGWKNAYEKFVKPDEETLKTKNTTGFADFQTYKKTEIDRVAQEQKDDEADCATLQAKIDTTNVPEDKKRFQADLDLLKKTIKHTYSEKYEADKKEWDAETKKQGFMEFTLAFAEFSFFVISSVVGFMLFKC